MLQELEPLLVRHISGVAINQLRVYPGPADLTSYLSGGVTNLCFLDTHTNPDRAVELLGEIATIDPSIHVIALLSGDQPELMLRCLRAGAADFLIQPFSGEQLEAAMAKLARLAPATDGDRKSAARIVTVVPAKGSCGATTLACNLAMQFKRNGSKRVLLADLDPLTGTISFQLKLKSTYSFLDILVRDSDLDDDLWKAMVVPFQGVDVLLAPELMVEGVSELRDPAPILSYARQHYDVIVLDASGVYGDWSLGQARHATEILLVTTNELPALQAAQRALSYLDSNRIGRWKIKLVVSRYHRDVGLNREVIGTALHTDVFHILPSDYEAIQRALMEGKPIAINSPYGKALKELVGQLSGGKEEAVKRASGFGGLLSIFSRG